MTDKQLRRLKKLELLEIMIAQDKELEDLRARLAETEQRLKASQAMLMRLMPSEAPRQTVKKPSAPAAQPGPEPMPQAKPEPKPEPRPEPKPEPVQHARPKPGPAPEPAAAENSDLPREGEDFDAYLRRILNENE